MTNALGFVRSPLASVASWLLNHQQTIQAKRGGSADARPITQGLEDSLRTLLPLTAVESRRYLLLATRSEWTAYLDNGRRGTDTAILSHIASTLACQAVRAYSAEQTKDRAGRVLQYGARIFELYGPEKTNFLNYVRTISVANDGGRWRIDLGGTPLASEDEAWFSPRKVADKFEHEHLAALLNSLGIDAYDESFYLPQGVLVERSGPTGPGYAEYHLEDLHR
jgi:hypothetical protein